MRKLMILALAAGIASLAACGMSKREQLEAVAKDWCETIRASQIIPVYPLTEDIQPGDIFLVQVPVDRQQEIYRRRGFLPLDNHLARRNPQGYTDFYGHSFFAQGESKTLPRDWSRPGGTSTTSWQPAPNAAFPSYSFTVTQAGGLNLAIPISGVPVGLGLMGTQEARGSVTIDDARTLGIDTMSLYQEVTAWVDDTPGVREFLANFGDDSPRPANYLRVITRIYATGRVSVLLTDARTVSAAVDAGIPKPVDLFAPRSPERVGDTTESARANFTAGLGHLNEMMKSNQGAATHASGDDSGLTPEQLAAKSEARAKERADELKTVQADHKTAKENVTKFENEAAPLQKDLDEKLKKRGESKEKLDKANLAVTEAQAALALTTAGTPEHTAAQTALANANTAQTTAKTELDTANTAVGVAQKAYDNKALVVANARGTLDVRQAALARLTDFAPGGSVRFTMASSRAVAMEETFQPPLVIGYLGFDMPILSHGRLGTPIPTYAVVSNDYTVPISTASAQARNLNERDSVNAAYEAVLADSSAEARSLRKQLDRLSRHIPASIQNIQIDTNSPRGYSIITTSRAQPAGSSSGQFADYMSFRDNRRTSINAAESILHDGQLGAAGGATYRLTPADREQLSTVIDSLNKQIEHERSEYGFAVRSLFDYYANTTFR